VVVDAAEDRVAVGVADVPLEATAVVGREVGAGMGVSVGTLVLTGIAVAIAAGSVARDDTNVVEERLKPLVELDGVEEQAVNNAKVMSRESRFIVIIHSGLE
jgi:hypothetical protein